MSIFNIEPHKVSRSLKGYSVMLYGDPKSGKTSTAVRFPKHLLVAFEKGYAAIPGAMPYPVDRWTQFLDVISELETDEAKEKFETIIIDTADIAYDLCEKFICMRNGVESIGDIPYGKGYSLLAQEYDEKLRKITQMGYGLVLISHSTDKTFTDEQGIEYNQIVPTLPKKANTIVSRLCDIIGYSRNVTLEDGTNQTRLFMRGTPRFMAGSRFRDVPSVGYQFPHSIELSYDELTKTIAEAVDAIESGYGESSVTSETGTHNLSQVPELDLEDVLEEFNQVAAELMEKNSDYYGPRIQAIVENYFGVGGKVSEATLAQTDLANIVLKEVKDLLG